MRGARHLALVGLSGTGKSTVAPLVANAIGRRAVDIDRQVEVGAGESVTELFAARGEADFRRLELEAVRANLEGEDSVVSCGGGVVTTESARRLLGEQCEVVWLRAEPAELADRLREGTEHRPLLADDAETALRILAREREPLYAEVADHVVDVDGMTVQDVVDRIIAEIEATGP